MRKPPSSKNTVENTIKAPILLQKRVESETERFSKDLQSRPSEPTRETYSKVPVEEFGAALLRGMGWKGPDASDTNKPIKYVARPERLGLGASQIKDLSELKQRKPVEQSLGIELSKEEEKKMQQIDRKKQKAADLEFLEKHANVIGIDEAGPKRIKLQVAIGSRITICEGEHVGLRGIVQSEAKDSKFWVIQLLINEQNVLIPKSFVKLENLSTESNSCTVVNNTTTPSVEEIDLWACSGLKVKIKSKSFLNGRYYNRKGIILDVQSDKTCTIQLLTETGKPDPTHLLPKVPQKTLQTCLPRSPNPTRPTVKYLRKDRGENLFQAACRVLQFDDERGRAVVQVEDDLEIVFEAHYDDICEFN